MTFKIIKPEDSDQEHPRGNSSVFLAGSIDNGVAHPWHSDVEDALQDFPITVFNPRRTEWLSELRQDISEPEFNYQVTWELDRLETADFVFIYFAPASLAPITLMELGFIPVGKSAIVCCPEGYWRRGNVQMMCHRKSFEFVDTFDKAIDILCQKVKGLKSDTS